VFLSINESPVSGFGVRLNCFELRVAVTLYVLLPIAGCRTYYILQRPWKKKFRTVPFICQLFSRFGTFVMQPDSALDNWGRPPIFRFRSVSSVKISGWIFSVSPCLRVSVSPW
jgi:hypothetical protein